VVRLASLCLAVVVCLPGFAAAQTLGDGPPPPLAGVPIDFRCEARVGPSHPLLRRHTGQDLHDLARGEAEGPEELIEWLDEYLCSLVWERLELAGAHRSPDDVRLPARAVLEIGLVSVELEGTRVVEQRIGSTVMPVSVPHWALQLQWWIRFDIEYAAEGNVLVRTSPLEMSPSAGAEQEDYTPLRVGALLRATTAASFRDLPRILVDEGRLGDLLFSVVERPPSAPPELGVEGALADGFWNLLAPKASHRHDALAFVLSSEAPRIEARRDLARWFALNDSDLGVRRDALAWLLHEEPPPDAERDLDPELVGLMRWLLVRDKSPRMRAEVTSALVGRSGDAVRELLLVASADADRRVSEIAVGALRTFEPPTAAEMAALEVVPEPPNLAGWTTALDGRVPMPPGNPDRFLLRMAAAAGGPAAETWTVRWLRHGVLERGDVEWAVEGWGLLAAHPSRRVRLETLSRLSRETDLLEVDRLLVARIDAEDDPVLRIQAIEALGRPDARGAVGALIEATKDDDASVRAAAASALGKVPGSEARGRLEVLLRNDPDGKVRRKARRALRAHDRLGG